MQRLILAVSLFLLGAGPGRLQSGEYSTLPIVITSITSQLTDSIMVSGFQTRSWPGKQYYRTGSYLYLLSISVTILDTAFWRGMKVGVACRLSDGTMVTHPIIPEELAMDDPHHFAFKFSVPVKRDGWIDCIIAGMEDIRTETHMRSYKRSSLKTPIYLKGPGGEK